MSKQTKQTKLSKSKRLAGNLSFDGEDRKEDHFFCAFETEACDHENCQPRVFTEEDYKFFFDRCAVVCPDGMYENLKVTKKREQVGNTKSAKILNLRLEAFGLACAIRDQPAYMTDILSRCKYDYQRDSILSEYIEYDNDEVRLVENIAIFVHAIPESYELRFTRNGEGIYYHFNHLIKEARRVREIKEENKRLKKRVKELEREVAILLLEKGTSIASALCEKIVDMAL